MGVAANDLQQRTSVAKGTCERQSRSAAFDLPCACFSARTAIFLCEVHFFPRSFKAQASEFRSQITLHCTVLHFGMFFARGGEIFKHELPGLQQSLPLRIFPDPGYAILFLEFQGVAFFVARVGVGGREHRTPRIHYKLRCFTG